MPGGSVAPVARAGGALGRPFWTVWTAGVVSFAGDGVIAGSLPLLTVSLTTDPRIVALVDASFMLGWLLLGLVSGVVVDRVDRLTLMSGVDLVRAVATAGFAWLVVSGQVGVPVLLGWALALGLASPFFDNAHSALIPDLVADEQIERANSLGQSAMLLTTSLVGPPIGAALFGAAGAAPFVIDAVSFAGSAVLLWLLVARWGRRRAAVAHSASRSAGTGPGPLRMLREGAAYLWADRTLRTLAIAVGIVNAVVGGVTAIFVLYVTEQMGLPGTAYGLLLAVLAVGGLLAALATPRLVRRLGPRRCATGALFVFAAVVIGLGLSAWVPAVVVALLVGGASSVVWDVTTISYRQRVVPAELLGRVTAIYRTVAFFGMPAGAVLIGQLAHAWGTPRAYVAGGLALLAGALWTAPRVAAMSRSDAAS